MNKKWELSRRTFLKGSGVSIALPVLEAMLPALARAEALGATKRLVYIYAPIGIQPDTWTPSSGTLDNLPSTIAPLAPFRSHLTVISGLDHSPANPSGAGDHASSGGAWLTGVAPLKTTSGARAATSVDQLVAQQIGGQTRISSLSLSCSTGGNSGDCDSGYSCAYTNNISWLSATTPNTKQTNPQTVFNAMFSSGVPNQTAAQEAKRNRYKKSILDYALESATSLRAKLGKSDQLKVDEHLNAVREIERKIGSSTPPMNSCAPGTAPTGVPSDYQVYMRLMYDLMALAFQCDITRVATFMLTNEGDNRSYNFIGVSEGHHSISHQENLTRSAANAKLQTIDRWRVEQLAYFIQKLYNATEGTGRLLDNMIVVYGTGLHYYSHSHQDLPIAVIGKGGGTITGNRHLTYNVPFNNLHLTVLNKMGVSQQSFGNSSGLITL